MRSQLEEHLRKVFLLLKKDIQNCILSAYGCGHLHVTKFHLQFLVMRAVSLKQVNTLKLEKQ